VAAEEALPEPVAPAAVSAGTPQAPAPGSQAKAQPQVARPKRLASVEPPARLAPTLTTVPVSMNAKPWARIEVDGREVGITPLADVPLATGHHRFRAHLPDGSVVEREARVDAQRDHVVFP
jgi:hypothetical protein